MEDSVAAQFQPRMDAGTVTIGKMCVSPSGRMVDFFFRTVSEGLSRRSTGKAWPAISPGSRRGLGFEGEAGSVSNSAASIARSVLAGRQEGDRICCGEGGGDERRNAEQE
jgi:hypothetical protein